MVKIKAKEYAFYKFIETKEKHSKMKDLWYAELGLQNYLKLEQITAFEAKTLFSYRTRSAKFSDNFRGSSGLSPCPLCLMHLDCQSLAFQCPVIRENVQIKEKYENIFNTSVTKDLVQTLLKIDRVRDEHMYKKSLL